MVHHPDVTLDQRALCDYLADQGLGAFEPRAVPAPINGGFVNSLWRLTLVGPWPEELVLRRFGASPSAEALWSEFEAHRFVFDAGYPCPRPLWLETDPDVLGAPFLIMTALRGDTLMTWLDRPGPRALRVPTVMAAAMARLHRIPTRGFPPSRPVLDTELALSELEARAESAGGDDYTVAVVERLRRATPPPTSDLPVIAHLDFNPPNVLMRGRDLEGVVDWTNCHLADRHLDVADVDVTLRCADIELTPAMARVDGVGRRILARRFSRAYRRAEGLRRDKMPWWCAVAAARRRAAAIRDAPTESGERAAGFTSPAFIRNLTDYIERHLSTVAGP